MERIDDETGMVIDHDGLDRKVIPIIDELDHKRLDLDVNYFKDVVTTGENISKYLWQRCSEVLEKNLYKIRVWENETSYFDFIKEN